jgi:hypothetical protein
MGVLFAILFHVSGQPRYPEGVSGSPALVIQFLSQPERLGFRAVHKRDLFQNNTPAAFLKIPFLRRRFRYFSCLLTAFIFSCPALSEPCPGFHAPAF